MIINSRTWVEIDQKALRQNVASLKKVIPKNTVFIAVVKGNAYGHGMLPVSKILEKTKEVDMLAVFTYEEGVLLRKEGIKKPILVLKNATVNDVTLAIKNNLEATISSLEALSKIKNQKSKIHICVDTGLGRDGFLEDERNNVVSVLKKNKNINVVGLFTHFSGAEEREFDSYTKGQFNGLIEWKKFLNDNNIFPKVHASATSGAFLGKDFALDMVRFGIGLYGLWPSPATKQLAKKINLEPVLSWRAKISEIKNLKTGSFVGYDLTYKTKKDTKVAVVPVGYYDGYSRALSGRASALVNGVRVPQIGRVMMNMAVFDVSAVKGVKEGDMITLVGKDKKGSIEISVDELAESRGTINYELVTRINPEILRVII
ncbi:MAG: alanine racemase [Candidatus Pacebacteria bacterium]|nr:alanine racemase [Candidatus Paceibacterota bacterium]